ncbi:sulfite exporter TauE/SafE family protein [Vagococcus coleopterorum]|uniref:Probable membrane transporter protein n=1 Tax=Vagococcus coleopterorum TaxID=2714946 RepID=A0A6G8AMU3_9ENTE|nr:sulfite exporter TauE/SafE family protein [Vagococcus coleopterorum]QIL46316.1 sulfite exporter TauE/SafE family protein [Vagococcus coleopterorum]
MVYAIYFLIIIFANTIGAISGVGGGVIIKPLFETFGFHSLENILFFSCVAVFTMAIASTFKQVRNGFSIDYVRAGAISVGSVIGGTFGNKLVTFLLDYFGSQTQLQILQIVLTVSSFIIVFFYSLRNAKTLDLTGPIVYLLVGIFLGGFSTLLGIGGGPINVSLLIFCFGLKMKEATIYSIITILFSQLAKLVEIATSTGFGDFDLSVLWVIVPAAILGGYIGGMLSCKFCEKRVGQIFTGVVLLVIFINLYNAWQILG